MRGSVRVAAAGLLLASTTAWAGRPLTIDDADPVGFRQFEFEAGVGYFHALDCRHWELPLSLTYGLLPGLEFGLGFGGAFEERTESLGETGREARIHASGLGDVIFAAKWRFLDEASWLPRQAMVAAVKLPTADEDRGLGSGKTDVDLTWVASKALNERIGAHLNVGYSWIGELAEEEVGDVLHYGVALDYQLSAPLQWLGEVFAEEELRGGTATVVQCNTGCRWQPGDSLTLDLAVGTKISGDAPDLTATAGLTWAFGFTKTAN